MKSKVGFFYWTPSDVQYLEVVIYHTVTNSSFSIQNGQQSYIFGHRLHDVTRVLGTHQV